MSDLTGRQPKAITSAVHLLEAVAHAGPGVSAAELAAATGIPRATAYRLLNLLVAEELLVRMPDLSGFALGARVGALVDAAAPVRLVSAVREELRHLRSGVRAAVHLLVVRGGLVRVADADPDVGLPVGHGGLAPIGSAVAEVLAGCAECRYDDDPVRGLTALAVAVRNPDDELVAVLLATCPTTATIGVAGYASRLHGVAKALGPLLG
ncbi:helix-turn-helix domain-containing protein [Kineococcus sp. GCM10028916]|uniref:helix-turn-helix domain-containing protein n=1 Tax=Kineococcus sp. GCM10028916 TaxID=3273394 RepID=UPI00363C704E